MHLVTKIRYARLARTAKQQSEIADTSQNEKALLDLAQGCNEVAHSMLEGLAKYPAIEAKTGQQEWERPKQNGADTSSRNGRGHALRSIKAALNLVWGSGKLAEMQEKLHSYRQQISIRLLVVLNSNQRVQSQMMQELQKGNREIVEVLSLQYNTLKLELDERNQRYTKLINTTREEAEQRHAESLAAILTTRSGHSTTMTSLDGDVLKDSVDQSQTLVSRVFRTGDQDSTMEEEEGSTIALSADMRQLTEQILNCLRFREMAAREATVTDAYHQTFEWIYDEPQGGTLRWDSFIKWLRYGSGLYWINGKAGSGKSTLMKFIKGHPSTFTHLRAWAGHDQLVVGTFFFWYAGTALQKSQVGLLRSLLLCVLSQQKELVPVLFPNVIRSIQSGQQTFPLELTDVELHSAFQRLVRTELLSKKVCFFIDGLDEYHGDRDELASLFAQATRSDRLKIALSSRPIPACVYAFGNYPKLRLQDLTFQDVWHFASDQLTQHPLMQRMELLTPGAAKELVTTIAAKSSGVFLWVSVVVGLLIRGLRDYDTLPDLRQKLIDMPEELESLYSHMLCAMPKHNRVQGSRYLQIVFESFKVHGSYPITLLQLSFAEEADHGSRFCDPTVPLSYEEESWRLESTEGRLRSRCCGLLEVHDSTANSADKRAATVVFLHRTMAEFLTSQTNWTEIQSWTGAESFDCPKALLCSSAAELTTRVQPRDATDETIGLQALGRLFTFEETLCERGQRMCRNHYLPLALKELYKAWKEKPLGRGNQLLSSQRERFLATAVCHVSKTRLEPLLEVLYSFSLDLRRGPSSPDKMAACLLSEYFGEQGVEARASLTQGITFFDFSPNTLLFLDWKDWPRDQQQRLSVRNHPNARWSLWELLLRYLQELTTSDLPRLLRMGVLDTFPDIMICFLKRGANVRFRLVVQVKEEQKKRKGKTRTRDVQCDVDHIVKDFCCSFWKAKQQMGQKTIKPSIRTAEPMRPLLLIAQKLSIIQEYFDTEAYTKVKAEARPQKWEYCPWKDYLAQTESSTALTRRVEVPSDDKVNEEQAARRWVTTSRKDRVRLLSDTDQDLVNQLIDSDGTSRSQRMILSALMQRTAEEQEKIWQCADAIKQAKNTPENA